MHIRTLTKSQPPLAGNIEETLDIITYVLSIINNAVNLYRNIFKIT